MIAARLQERAFGGLDRDSLRFLQSLARHELPSRPQLKPGTVLVREYQGRRHIITTVRDGFDWQGTTYPSLSAVARAITGTVWSGPRFFALQAAGDGSKPKRRSAAAADAARPQRRPASRNGPQALNGSSSALHLETHPMHKPETKDSFHASLLEGLSQVGPGLVPDRTARRLLDRRAHRLPADQQGHRQPAASAAHR